jgi:hypothetical protein
VRRSWVNSSMTFGAFVRMSPTAATLVRRFLCLAIGVFQTLVTPKGLGFPVVHVPAGLA